MKLSQWNKKGWPYLNDLELEDIARFRMPTGKKEYLVSDPDYVASYYYVSEFCLVIPSWAGLRRYDSAFMKELRYYVDQDNLVDDIGVLEEKNTGDYLYRFDDQIIRVKNSNNKEKIKHLRSLIKAKYSEPKLVSNKMLSVWKKKIPSKGKPSDLIPVGACSEFSQTVEACRKIVHNVEIAQDLTGDQKFRVYCNKNRKLLKIDAGGYRLLVECR